MEERISFEKSAKPLTQEDIAGVERRLNLNLPKHFTDFYLKYNGGVPSKSYILYEENDEFIEISVFFSLLHKREKSDDDTIEDRYLSLTKRKVIPLDYLPFAKDWCGNLFCLNLQIQQVVFVLLDMGPVSEKSFLPLALSFEVFISSLVTEEEAEAAEEGEEDDEDDEDS